LEFDSSFGSLESGLYEFGKRMVNVKLEIMLEAFLKLFKIKSHFCDLQMCCFLIKIELS
jgi:hypothetical protein